MSQVQSSFKDTNSISGDVRVNNRPFIVACIPAYNEEATIAKVILQTRRHVDHVIVCDDGSTDVTGEIAQALGAEVIRHERNMGYGAALSTLFARARELGADVMVLLDGDGQHDPAEIPNVMEPILKGEADVVTGSRFIGGNNNCIPRYRKSGIKAITKLARAMSYDDLTDAQCGFRAFNKKAIILLTPNESGMGASTELLLKAKENKLRLKEVPVKVKYELSEPSSQNALIHGMDVVLSTLKYISTKRPLLFYGLPGIIALIIGLGFWVWTFQEFAIRHQVITNIA
ncbi:MAG: glycosyltransferase family 2 protein, partial [Nitrososphaerota archaeon]|nr:glycosyltransferase family 2 protein [Nitrososphaerota archaeon]